jgi:hypothetical protein
MNTDGLLLLAALADPLRIICVHLWHSLCGATLSGRLETPAVGLEIGNIQRI